MEVSKYNGALANSKFCVEGKNIYGKFETRKTMYDQDCVRIGKYLIKVSEFNKILNELLFRKEKKIKHTYLTIIGLWDTEQQDYFNLEQDVR